MVADSAKSSTCCQSSSLLAWCSAVVPRVSMAKSVRTLSCHLCLFQPVDRCTSRCCRRSCQCPAPASLRFGTLFCLAFPYTTCDSSYVGLTAIDAHVSGTLLNLVLLHDFPQRVSVTSPIFSCDSGLFGAFCHCGDGLRRFLAMKSHLS